MRAKWLMQGFNRCLCIVISSSACISQCTARPSSAWLFLSERSSASISHAPHWHAISLKVREIQHSWLGVPMDRDEVECILANLIYKGLVRGYISHEKATLVLSKKEPFPLSAVLGR